MNKRRRFFYYLVREVFKVAEGQILPKYLIVLKCILFPIESFYFKINKDFYDPYRDIYTINGIKFSGQFFKNMNKVGSTFKIEKLEDGTLTLSEIFIE
jgi:hypothetical protein